MKQYSTFILLKDISSTIKKGMTGVILEIYDSENIEVEFLNEEGINYIHENSATITIKTSIISHVHDQR